jgi:1-phosphofructokinase
VFAAFFSALGVRDRCLRLPGATRTGIKIVDTESGATTDLNFPGLRPGPDDLAALVRELDSLDAGWCVLAGSLPPGVPATFYRDAAARLKARGVRVAIDTSGEALREAIPAAPDFIKPNVHELEAHLGRELGTEAEVIAAARELVAGGVGLVVVSRGADGACFVTADEAVVARPPAIEVGSTVGAGDAMVAGIVAGRAGGLPLAECARLATAFSLFALTRDKAGAEPRAAVAAFAGRVEIRAG